MPRFEDDPNILRQKKAALLDQAQRHRDNAAAAERAMTGPEQRSEERLLECAHEHERQAQAIEAKEAASAARAKAKR
jgi:hypothetical protein